MQKRIQKLINKEIYHDTCEIIPNEKGECSVVLPCGVIFTGEIDAIAAVQHGRVTVGYLAEVGKMTRNFKFRVVKNTEHYKLPHNMAFVGSRIVPLPVGHVLFNVYVEKEL